MQCYRMMPRCSQGLHLASAHVGSTIPFWELCTFKCTGYCSLGPTSSVARIAETRSLYTQRVLDTESHQNIRGSATTPAARPITGAGRRSHELRVYTIHPLHQRYTNPAANHPRPPARNRVQ